MHDDFQQALTGLDVRHVLADPPGSPDDTALELLSRYRQGQFAYQAHA